jgi:hypothetical protein
MSSFPFVRLVKLRAAVDPLVQPGRWDTYHAGSSTNTTSLPVDYEILGFLLQAPIVGGQVRVLRIQRNGINALGIFQSTEVTAVGEGHFTTQNSVYRLEPMPTADGMTHYPCEGGHVVHGLLPDGSLLALGLRREGKVEVVFHGTPSKHEQR